MDHFKCRKCCSNFTTFSELRQHIRKNCKDRKVSSSGCEELLNLSSSNSSSEGNSALPFYRSHSPDENANYLSSCPKMQLKKDGLSHFTAVWTEAKESSLKLVHDESITYNPQLSSMKAIVKLARIDSAFISSKQTTDQSPSIVDNRLSDLLSRFSCGLHDETSSDSEFYDETTTGSETEVDVVTTERSENFLCVQSQICIAQISRSSPEKLYVENTGRNENELNEGSNLKAGKIPTSSAKSSKQVAHSTQLSILKVPNSHSDDFFTCTLCTSNFSTHLLYQIHRLRVHGR